MFCRNCCLHMSMKPAAFSMTSVPIYQTTLCHSPEDGDHCTLCCDNPNLISHTAVSAKLTQILGQFLQSFLFVQTGNTEQTATWNTVQHLQSQTWWQHKQFHTTVLLFVSYPLIEPWVTADPWKTYAVSSSDPSSCRLSPRMRPAPQAPLLVYFSPSRVYSSTHTIWKTHLKVGDRQWGVWK